MSSVLIARRSPIAGSLLPQICQKKGARGSLFGMMIPTMNVSNIQRALDFYTGVLDFAPAHVWSDDRVLGYAVLQRGDDELHLSGFGGKPFQHAAIVVVPEVDDLFRFFRSRGLDPSGKPDSPMHQGPVDQTWGTREFSADDPDGNTLVFQKR